MNTVHYLLKVAATVKYSAATIFGNNTSGNNTSGNNTSGNNTSSKPQTNTGASNNITLQQTPQNNTSVQNSSNTATQANTAQQRVWDPTQYYVRNTQSFGTPVHPYAYYSNIDANSADIDNNSILSNMDYTANYGNQVGHLGYYNDNVMSWYQGDYSTPIFSNINPQANIENGQTNGAAPQISEQSMRLWNALNNAGYKNVYNPYTNQIDVYEYNRIKMGMDPKQYYEEYLPQKMRNRDTYESTGNGWVTPTNWINEITFDNDKSTSGFNLADNAITNPDVYQGGNRINLSMNTTSDAELLQTLDHEIGHELSSVNRYMPNTSMREALDIVQQSSDSSFDPRRLPENIRPMEGEYATKLYAGVGAADEDQGYLKYEGDRQVARTNAEMIRRGLRPDQIFGEVGVDENGIPLDGDPLYQFADVYAHPGFLNNLGDDSSYANMDKYDVTLAIDDKLFDDIKQDPSFQAYSEDIDDDTLRDMIGTATTQIGMRDFKSHADVVRFLSQFDNSDPVTRTIYQKATQEWFNRLRAHQKQTQALAPLSAQNTPNPIMNPMDNIQYT